MKTIVEQKLNVNWFGKVPKDWDVQKISAIFDFQSQKVSDKDFEALSVTYAGIKKQIESAAKSDNGSNRKLVRKNDIVVNGRSDRKGAIGVSDYDGSVSLIYHVLRKRNSEIDPKYYHYLFRSKLFSEEFFRWGRGIVDDLWTTRANEMKRIQVPVPPIEVQKTIVSFLEKRTNSIKALILTKQKMIELLHEKRNAFIDHSVTKGLDNSKKTIKSRILGKVPFGWEIKRLRFIANLNPTTDKSLLLKETLVSFVPMEAISESGRLDLSSNQTLEKIGSGYTFFRNGDVVRAKITPCFQNGKGAVAKKLMNGFALGTTELHVLRPRENVSPEFLYFLTLSDRFQKLGEINMRGVAGQQRVPEIFIKDFLVALPTLQEQKKIVETVNMMIDKIDMAIEMMENHITKLREYRSSLICSAVLGNIS